MQKESKKAENRVSSASPAPGRRQGAWPAPGGARQQSPSAWPALFQHLVGARAPGQRLEAPEHGTTAINQKLVIFRFFILYFRGELLGGDF